MAEKGLNDLVRNAVIKLAKYCERYGYGGQSVEIYDDSDLSVNLSILKNIVHNSFPMMILEKEDNKKESNKQIFNDMNDLISLISSCTQKVKEDFSILEPFSAIVAILLFLEDTRDTAYDVLLKMFMKYKSYRASILRKIQKVLKLLHDQNVRALNFQVVTSLILSFLQSIPSCGVSELRLKSSLTDLEESFNSSFQEVRNIVCQWIYGFLVVSVPDSSKNIKFDCRYVVLLKNFLKSLMSFVENLEYVSSVFVSLMILRVLSAFLTEKKNPVWLRKLALEQIILICNDFMSLKSKSRKESDVIKILRSNHPQILNDLNNNITRKENVNELLSTVELCLYKHFISYLKSCSDSSICPAYFYTMSIRSNIPNVHSKDKGKKRKLTEMNSDSTNIQEMTFWILRKTRANSNSNELSESEALEVHLCLLFSCIRLEMLMNRYLLQVILTAADEKNSLRLCVIKSINLMIENNVTLLLSNPLKIAISSCINDSSSSVRESILIALEKIIFVHPCDKYMQIIVDNFDRLMFRIRDVDVDVRKAALSMLTRFCVENRKNDIVKKMIPKIMSRICDDDATIRTRTIEAFHVLWFTNEEESSPENTVVSEIIDSCNNDFSHFEILMKGVTAFESQCSSENKNNFVNFNYETRLQLVIKCFENLLAHLRDAKSDHRIPIYFIISKNLPKLLEMNFKEISAFVVEQIEDLNQFEQKIRSLQQILSVMEVMLKVEDETNDSDVFHVLKKSIHLQIPLLKLNVYVIVFQFYLSNLIRAEDFKHEIQTLCTGSYNILQQCLTLESVHKTPPVALDKCVYTLGLLMTFFESDLLSTFTEIDLKEYLCNSICNLNPSHVTPIMVKTLGLLSGKYQDVWEKGPIQKLFLDILRLDCNERPQIEVIETILNILKEEEKAIIVRDSKNENSQSQIKSSTPEPATTTLNQSMVINVFLSPVLKLFLNENVKLRICVSNLCNFLCRKLMINPNSIMNYLICMLCDVRMIQVEAENTLKFIIEKYPTFVNPSLHEGIKLCCSFLSLEPDSEPRGYRIVDSEPVAVFSALFQAFLLPQKHVFIQTLLQEFDRKELSMQCVIFVADNLAHLPYKDQKELQSVIRNLKVLERAVDLICSLAMRCDIEKHKAGPHNMISDLEQRVKCHVKSLVGKWSDDWLFKANVCIIMLQLRKHLRKLPVGSNGKMKDRIRFEIPDSVKFCERSKDYFTDKRQLIPIIIKTYLQLQALLDEESDP